MPHVRNAPHSKHTLEAHKQKSHLNKVAFSRDHKKGQSLKATTF